MEEGEKLSMIVNGVEVRQLKCQRDTAKVPVLPMLDNDGSCFYGCHAIQALVSMLIVFFAPYFSLQSFNLTAAVGEGYSGALLSVVLGNNERWYTKRRMSKKGCR